jgi:hypothetical protein
MTFGTRSHAVYERLAFPPKIAKHSLAMPIIQWPVIMRVPMLATYCSRPICFSIERVRAR